MGRTVRAVAVEKIRSRSKLEGSSPTVGAELGGAREAMDGVLSRLDRLEEERDFYKDLLDAPGSRREISPPAGAPPAGGPPTGAPPSGEDAAGSGVRPES